MIASPVAAGAVGRVAIVSKLDCSVEDVDLNGAEPLDWEFHPVGSAIGSHQSKYFFGAMVWNPILVAGFAAVLMVLVGVLVASAGRKFKQACGNLRSPGLAYIPVIFLLQGTSLSAVSVAFFPRDEPKGVEAVGWFMLLGCFALPFVIWRQLLRRRVFKATQIPDPRLCADSAEFIAQRSGKQHKLLSGRHRCLYKFAFGARIWVSTDPESYFVERFGVVFEPFREGMQWFACVELAGILSLSALAAWHPGSDAQCHVRNALLCLCFFALIVAVVKLRPYTSLLDNILSAALAAMMLIAIFCIALQIALGGGAALLLIATFFLLLSCFALLLKCIWDLVLYVLDMHLGRRKGAQVFSLGCEGGDLSDKQEPLLPQSVEQPRGLEPRVEAPKPAAPTVPTSPLSVTRRTRQATQQDLSDAASGASHADADRSVGWGLPMPPRSKTGVTSVSAVVSEPDAVDGKIMVTCTVTPGGPTVIRPRGAEGNAPHHRDDDPPP
eukprot:gene30412-20419_t